MLPVSAATRSAAWMLLGSRTGPSRCAGDAALEEIEVFTLLHGAPRGGLTGGAHALECGRWKPARRIQDMVGCIVLGSIAVVAAAKLWRWRRWGGGWCGGGWHQRRFWHHGHHHPGEGFGPGGPHSGGDGYGPDFPGVGRRGVS